MVKEFRNYVNLKVTSAFGHVYELVVAHASRTVLQNHGIDGAKEQNRIRISFVDYSSHSNFVRSCEMKLEGEDKRPPYTKCFYSAYVRSYGSSFGS